MQEQSWAQAEKKTARRVFDAALQAELSELLLAFRQRAAAATTPDDMWAIAESLLDQRRDIERKYDFRYSQLLVVFGRLIKEKRVRSEDLRDFSDDKLSVIQRIASL